MKKSLSLLAFYLLTASFVSSQNPRLPRDPEKLIARAQRFWNAMTSGQRLQALEFILPEKKNLFISGNAVPILKATVLGVDLTTEPGKANVRVGLDMLSVEAAAGRVNWTITDPWVWRGDNWYVNLENPADIIPKAEALAPVDSKQFRSDIEKNFQILRDPVDVGTLKAGQHLTVDVPISYTGDVPISIELGFPNPLVDIGISEPITSRSKKFVLLVGADNWEGPFNLPLPLKIQYRGATVERTLFVKGEVFVPLAFRQSPPDQGIQEGREFSLFIRNNTDEQAAINFFSTGARFFIVKQPTAIPPHEEAELVLKLKPGQAPDIIYVYLERPLQGQDIYTYRFRNVRP